MTIKRTLMNTKKNTMTVITDNSKVNINLLNENKKLKELLGRCKQPIQVLNEYQPVHKDLIEEIRKTLLK